jgi:hypothetical protein
VVLVVDDSAFMVIWWRTVAELYELLVRQAALRDVRVMRFTAGQPGDEPPHLHPAAVGAAYADFLASASTNAIKSWRGTCPVRH